MRKHAEIKLRDSATLRRSRRELRERVLCAKRLVH